MKGIRVLIVDDDDDLRSVLCDALRKRGYEATDSASAASGLRILQHHSFDLILSDVVMPDMDGIEFLRKVKKENPDQPVVLMSGNTIGQQFFKAAELFGSKVNLQKPFSIDEMLTAIGRVLDSQSGTNANS